MLWPESCKYRISRMSDPASALPSQQQFTDDVPSLDVVYDQAQWAMDRAHADADGIDAKSGVVLGASSFLLAGIAALQVAIGSHVVSLPRGAPTPTWEIASRWLAGLAALSFLAVVAFSGLAMWPRKFSVAPTPVELRDLYLKAPGRKTKAIVMHARVDHYQETMDKVNRKADHMTKAFFALALEALLVAIILGIVAIARSIGHRHTADKE